jgi:hypothetical protein
MPVVAFPTPKPRPRVTADDIAFRLLDKVEAGEPGAIKLLARWRRTNPDYWTDLAARLAEPKGVVLPFSRGQQ